LVFLRCNLVPFTGWPNAIVYAFAIAQLLFSEFCVKYANTTGFMAVLKPFKYLTMISPAAAQL